MNIAQERNYSRESREWIPLTIHRTGWYSSPNLINIANGYITGLQGFPQLFIKHMRGSTEIYRGKGSYTPQESYQDGDEIYVRAANLAEIRTFYVRYNQVKQLQFNLGDLTSVKAIGLRNNGISGLGHVDLSNCHELVNLDLSGNSSVTGLTVSSQAPIDFYYLGGTSVPQATIDYVLQMAVDSGVVNGQMGYDVQPSASSQANYDTLIARGWQLSSEPVQVVAVNHTISAPISLTETLQAVSVSISADLSDSIGQIQIDINLQAITVSGTTNPTGPEQETIDYMTAIGVPDDSTMTIYGLTGSEVWTLFNDVVLIAKNAGELDNIYAFYPVFGDNASQAGKMMWRYTTDADYNFYGSVVFDANGVQMNGANTYGLTQNGYYLDLIAQDRGLAPPVRTDFGVTLAANTSIVTNANLMEIGSRTSSIGYLLLSTYRNAGETRYSVGDNAGSIVNSVSDGEGVHTGQRTGNTLKMVKNGTTLGTTTVADDSGFIVPESPIGYGCYFNYTSPALYSYQRLLSHAYHKGGDTTASTVQQMIETWEAGLGRKTWT